MDSSAHHILGLLLLILWFLLLHSSWYSGFSPDALLLWGFLALAVLVLVALFRLWCRVSSEVSDRKRNQSQNHSLSLPLLKQELTPTLRETKKTSAYSSSLPGINIGSASLQSINRRNTNEEDPIIQFSAEEIKAATHNFSLRLHLGGLAYRCKINGRDVVVKRMSNKVATGGLQPLHKLRHENLVELVGVCCYQEEEQKPCKSFLVYEYVNGGSLVHNCPDPQPFSFAERKNVWNRPSPAAAAFLKGLSWRQRLQVAVDVANGLSHIHRHNSAHMNVKPSNVLLDEKLRAKLGDFAITSSGINADFAKNNKKLKPDKQQDIIAFGFLLVQLISGHKEAQLLIPHIKHACESEDREEKLRNWVDPLLQKSYQIDSVVMTAIIALECLRGPQRQSCPCIAHVAARLSRLLHVCFEHHECF